MFEFSYISHKNLPYPNLNYGIFSYKWPQLLNHCFIIVSVPWDKKISAQMKIKCKGCSSLCNHRTQLSLVGYMNLQSVLKKSAPASNFLLFCVFFFWPLVVLLHVVPQKSKTICLKTESNLKWMPKIKHFIFETQGIFSYTCSFDQCG